MLLLTRSLMEQREQLTKLLDWSRLHGFAVGQLGGGGPLLECVKDAVVGRDILISQDADLSNFEALRSNEKIDLLIPLRADYLDQDVDKTLRFLDKRSDKSSLILSNHVGGFQKTFRMLSSEQRWHAIEELGAYIESQAVFKGAAEVGKTVASELLTNAFYNAPQDTKGSALQPNRREVTEITPPSEVLFSFGDDGTHFWLSVTDPFGTFNRGKLLEHLTRCSGQDMLQVRQGVGGAGIGIYMIYRLASQLLFQFSPGIQTTVLIKLLKTKRQKIFESQRTTFEVVEVPGRGASIHAA
jgi:hypothetical protein